MTDMIKIAEVVRSACMEAALEAYEDAGIRGLCAEGRWEYAVQAISTLDLEKVLCAGEKHRKGAPWDNLWLALATD